MKQGKTGWLGFLAFLPLIISIVLLFYFLLSFVPSLLRMQQAGESQDAISLLTSMIPLLVITILAGLVQLMILVYFILHAINNRTIKSEERIIWVLVFIFFSGIGFPVYWYLRIREQAPPTSNFIRA